MLVVRPSKDSKALRNEQCFRLHAWAPYDEQAFDNTISRITNLVMPERRNKVLEIGSTTAGVGWLFVRLKERHWS